MTKEDIVQKLVAIYTNPSINVTAACGIFAFEYGEYVVDVYTAAELIQAANQIDPTVKLRYQAELGAAFAMYKYFKQHPELLSFSGSTSKPFQIGDAFQKITYGAPGTGKSWGIDQLTKSIPSNVIRTTFHPDSDYSTFVGAYKPTMKSVQRINCIDDKAKPVKDLSGDPSMQDVVTYEFVPQAFSTAYVNAWKLISQLGPDALEKPDGREYLVIEEINRGNCAQIFGDIFQLLDRKNGISEYPICPDKDLERYLAAELKDCSVANAGMCGVDVELAEQIFKGEKLVLPPNLHIWATMNTSDQSLFPIDSAFKRRWDWEYVPIRDAGKGWYIKVGETKYKWWSFLEKINKIVYGETQSADKQLGYFFVKLPGEQKEIDLNKFVNKVAFYLWNDVFKDCEIREDALKLKDENGKPGEPIKFTDFFKPYSNKPSEKVVKDLLEGLGVETEQ